MKAKVIVLLSFILSTGCTKYLTLSQSNATASEYFGSRRPVEVDIPSSLKGGPNDTYKIVKIAFEYNGKPIKLFYTLNKVGKIGNMLVDGLNLNTKDTTRVVYLTKEKFLSNASQCTTAQCILSLIKQADNDCRTFRDASNCWFCKQFVGESGEDCSWLD